MSRRSTSGVAVQALQAVAHVVREQLDFGAGDGFDVVDAFAKTVKHRALGLIAEGGLRAGGLGESGAATMTREQQIALGFRFHQFLLELDQRAFQRFHLRGLIVHLFAVADGKLLRGLEAVERGAGEFVMRFIDGDFGFAHPFLPGVFVFFQLLFEHVLVGDGDGDLRLHLEILVLHIEDDLLDQFFGVFGAVDHVVQIGADQSADAFQKSHCDSPYVWLRLRDL